jgi:hypothetical protein
MSSLSSLPRNTWNVKANAKQSHSFLDAVERALVHLGVFIGNFHAERFDLV